MSIGIVGIIAQNNLTRASSKIEQVTERILAK